MGRFVAVGKRTNVDCTAATAAAALNASAAGGGGGGGGGAGSEFELDFDARFRAGELFQPDAEDLFLTSPAVWDWRTESSTRPPRQPLCTHGKNPAAASF